MTDQKVFVNKTCYFSGGSCVAVERHMILSFLFMLHHQETLSSRLSKSLKKQEVCVVHV
jgi:hypothetical protein